MHSIGGLFFFFFDFLFSPVCYVSMVYLTYSLINCHASYYLFHFCIYRYHCHHFPLDCRHTTFLLLLNHLQICLAMMVSGYIVTLVCSTNNTYICRYAVCSYIENTPSRTCGGGKKLVWDFVGMFLVIMGL